MMNSDLSTESQGSGYAEKIPASRKAEDHVKSSETTSVVMEEEETNMRKLRRKIDWRILPIAISIYLFNFLDKVAFNVSSAERDRETAH